MTYRRRGPPYDGDYRRLWREGRFAEALAIQPLCLFNACEPYHDVTSEEISEARRLRREWGLPLDDRTWLTLIGNGPTW